MNNIKKPYYRISYSKEKGKYVLIFVSENSETIIGEYDNYAAAEEKKYEDDTKKLDLTVDDEDTVNKIISDMSEKEKDAFLDGTEFAIDYGLYIPTADANVYKAMMGI